MGPNGSSRSWNSSRTSAETLNETHKSMPTARWGMACDFFESDQELIELYTAQQKKEESAPVLVANPAPRTRKA